MPDKTFIVRIKRQQRPDEAVLGVRGEIQPHLLLAPRARFDALGRYAHDHERPVAQAAILALGIVGAGTNHARIAQMLRQLAQYYQRDGDLMVVVRLAQGLVDR